MDDTMQQILDNQENKESLPTRPTTVTETVRIPIQDISSTHEPSEIPVIDEHIELTVEAYQKELERKKQEQIEEENKYKNTMVRSTPDEKIVCLAIDGHETSTYAFDIILKEFLDRLQSTLMCTYIFNNVHDEEYNWRHQKSYVFETYKTKLITKLTEEQGKLVIQDTDPYYSHPIEQIARIANKNKCEYLFLGYNGLKTANFLVKNIKKGVDYLLRESNMPTVIFKDKYFRGVKNKGYKWLIVMDRASSDCFKVFDFFLPLMDLSRDFIYGLTLLPRYISFDDIKKQFDEKMKSIGIDEEQTFYQMEYYDVRPSEFVKTFVNKNDEHYFDFVVFYNNPDKYKVLKEDSESMKMVEKLNANICFVNGVYLEMKRIEEEKEKLKEEQQKGEAEESK